jgi:uncharacterized protein (TIGR02996 family)
MLDDTGQQLYRAVLAAPFDDALRLVYADWLDENNQPERAAFIRAQVKGFASGSVHYRNKTSGPVYELAARPAWNMARRRVTVPAELRVANSGQSWVAFERGFPSVAHTTAHQFMAHADKLFLHPVTTVHIADFRWEVIPGLDYVNLQYRHRARRLLLAVGSLPEKASNIAIGLGGHGLRKTVGRALVNWGRAQAGLAAIPDDQWPKPPAPRPVPSKIRTPPTMVSFTQSHGLHPAEAQP